MARASINRTWDATLGFIRAERTLLLPLAFGTLFLARLFALVLVALLGPNAAGPATLLAGLWGTVGELAIIALTLGRGLSVREALLTGVRRLPLAVLGLLIVGAASFLLGLPLLSAALRTGLTLEQLTVVMQDRRMLTQLANELSPAVKLYTFLALLVGLFVTVRLLVWKQALVDRHEGPIRAFRTSWEATRGRFWVLLGLMLLLGFVNLVTGWAVTNVLGSILLLFGVGQFTGQVIIALVVALIATLLTLVATVFLSIYYRSACEAR